MEGKPRKSLSGGRPFTTTPPPQKQAKLSPAALPSPPTPGPSMAPPPPTPSSTLAALGPAALRVSSAFVMTAPSPTPVMGRGGVLGRLAHDLSQILFVPNWSSCSGFPGVGG